MLIANYIKNIIKEKKINYVQLGEELGWNPTNVRLWARGINVPRKEALEDIAAFIDPKRQVELESMLFDMRIKDLQAKGAKRG